MSLARTCAFLIALSISSGGGALEEAQAPVTGLDVPDGPVVYGRIVDVVGHGIPGAQVLLAPGWRSWSRVDQGDFDRCALPDEMRALTDADGRFRIASPPPGALRIVVRKRGFVELDWNHGLVVTPGSHLDLGELALARAAVVHGRVVDAEGQTVAGAEIYRTWGEGGMYWVELDLVLARSDEEGRFTLDCLAQGNLWGGPDHDLGARAPGFYDLEFQLRLPTASEPMRWWEGDEADVVREDELVLSLTRGPTLRGGLRSFESLGDDAWVLVTRSKIDVEKITSHDPIDWGRTRDYQRQPDVFDRRILPVSKEGTFTVGALARPIPPYPALRRYAFGPVWLTPILGWQPWVVPAGPTLYFDDLGGDVPIELEVLAPARAELRVIDAESGLPLEELAVCVAPRGWTPKPLASTHFPDGRVEIEGRARALNLWIAARGHLPSDQAELPVVPGETVDLGVLELVPAEQISVRVIDAITGAPIAGARVGTREAYTSGRGHDVALEAPDFRSAITDLDGRARLNRGRSPTVEVWADAAGYALDWPPDEDDELDELNEMDQVIALQRVRRGNLIVTDADGAPVPGLPVTVNGEYEPTRFTDRDGRVRGIDDPRELRVLVPGAVPDDREAWSGCAWKAPDHEHVPAPGVDYDIALQLPPLQPIEVTVLDSDRPLAGALWGLAVWDEHVLPIDARGRLLGLERAPPGRMELSVWRPESKQTQDFELEITPGVERLVVDLARLDDE